MSKQPLISIVIVNYNGKKFIKECVDSVLKSDYPRFEIVVVDNASTDGSYELLKRAYQENKKVQIFRSDKQLYFSGGSNLGAKHALGEKLIFLNSDTVVDKDWIKELVALVKGHKKYLVQPKILSYWQKDIIDNVGGKYIFPGFGSGIGHRKKDLGQYDKNTKIDYTNGTCFMIDRYFFEKLGGFDEWYKFFYEDVDLSLRAKKQEGAAWYCHQSIIYHKGSLSFKSNVLSKELIFYIRKNRLRTVIKNFKGPERILRLTVLSLIDIFLALRDLLKFRTKVFVFFEVLSEVINYEYKLLIEKGRLRELRKIIKKGNFSLLDLGCGDASFLQLARKHGITALGVDKSPPFYSYVIKCPIENLELSKKFDAITMFHVLEHLNNPESILTKIKNWLKEDGVLVVETPLIGNFTERFLKKDYFAYQDKSHVHFFTKKELFTLLNKTGWKIKKKGSTLLEFPLTVITTNLKNNPGKALIGIILFLPFKFLRLLGLNDEIIRFYCLKS